MHNLAIDNVITVTPNPAIDFMLVADRWQRGAVTLGNACYMTPGGKGINVATGLAQLLQGQDTYSITATGWLGIDNDLAFVEHLADHDIVDQFIRVAGKTRTNVKITDPSDNDTTDINFSDMQVNEEQRARIDGLMKESVSDKTFAVLAGSLPVGVDADFYCRQIRLLRSLGCCVMLDANGRGLSEVVEQRAFPQVMKPNIHELREVTQLPLNSTQEIIAATKMWFDDGLELLIVSQGAKGALFITVDTVLTTTPPAVSVESTVGAGDSMVAGFIYSIVNNDSLVDAACFATAFSAAKVSSLRTDSGCVQKAQCLLSEVSVSVETIAAYGNNI